MRMQIAALSDAALRMELPDVVWKLVERSGAQANDRHIDSIAVKFNF